MQGSTLQISTSKQSSKSILPKSLKPSKKPIQHFNKENNSHIIEQNTQPSQLREQQQSSALVEENIEDHLNQFNIIKDKQRIGRTSHSALQKEPKKKQTFQYQPSNENANNISGMQRNIQQTSGSISSSFCIPTAAQIISQQQPIISINNSDFFIGSLQQSNFINNNETLDSNGNEIRGRKIDSPHLLVVREIRELEEEEDRDYNHIEDQAHGQFGSGSEELLNLIWNSRENKQINQLQNDSLRRQQRSKHSKSLENRGFTQQRHPQFKEQSKVKSQLSLQNKLVVRGGTKSQRDIRTSMGFNELLTQLDKDISVNHNLGTDFKNRTVHDILKLELSGIRRQYSQGGAGMQIKNELKSKSQGRVQSNAHQMQKSQKKQQKNEVTRNKRTKSKENLNMKQEQQIQKQQYGMNGSSNSGQILKKQQLDQLIGFIQSQTKRIQLENILGNDRTKSQSSLAGCGSGQIINLHGHRPQNQSRMQNQQQISPDKKQGGKIDKIVRENIKKNREKEDEEKLQKMKSEETIKRKKQQLDKNNNQVRENNKNKTYKKNIDTNMYQQSQDPIGLVQGDQNQKQLFLKKDWKEQVQFFKKLNINDKFSQSQKFDIDQMQSQIVNQQHKITRNNEKADGNFKNHRKSYGLEFIDIKREIEQEMKTIEIKMKSTMQMNNNNSMIRKRNNGLSQTANNTQNSIKKLKVKERYEKQEAAYRRDLQDDKSPFRNEKVPVIKKNKIRKFMAAKKKEHDYQVYQQHQDEIIKTIKMQQNLIKLNKFCKKSLGKSNAIKNMRKRNTTIQGYLVTENDCSEQERKDASKISHRKKDKSRKNLKVKEVVDSQNKIEKEDEIGDSSKLSTEFYEEYFRLINSIKKEQKEGSQKLILSEADLNSSNFTQLQRQLLKSPKNKESPQSMVDLIKPRNVISPSSQSQKSKSGKIDRKSKSKLSNKHQVSGNKATKKKLAQQHEKKQMKHKNERSDSAPLIYQRPSKNQTLTKADSDYEMTISQQDFVLSQIIKIQRFFKHCLQERGFYELQNNELSMDDEEFQTQIQNLNQQNSNMKGAYDRMQQIDDLDDDGSEFDEDDDQQLIIIQQHNNDDEKKIIYMSNINSCSLPQTPKDPNVKDDYGQQQNKVFEYRPHQQLEQMESNNSVIRLHLGKKSEEWDEENANRNANKGGNKIIKVGEEVPQFNGTESLIKEFKQGGVVQQKLVIEEQKQRAFSVNDDPSSQNSQVSVLQNNQFSVDNKKSEISSVKQVKIGDNTSLSSQSLFDRNSFQQFSQTKLNKIIQNNEFSNLINMREKALDYREKKEGKFIKKMYKNNQLSPRSYEEKKTSLERWVKVEKEEIKKTKKAFEEEWEKTVKMIEDTQKNVDQMREKMRISVDNNKHHQGIFNSQQSSSRNSSSNSNIQSVKQDQNKRQIKNEELNPSNGIFELQPPLSQRSWQQHKFVEEKKDENLVEFLELNWQLQQKVQQTDKLVQRQGIYIEDQNDKNQSSEISANDIKFIPQTSAVQEQIHTEQDEERSLHRSRSQQDLSELIKRNRIDDNDELEEFENMGDAGRNSFLNLSQKRLDESRKLQKGQQILENQIVIEENAFEEPSLDKVQSERESVSFYHDLNDEFESNDSLLNESDMNKYFQEQRFSLEDFKSLDKKKLLEKQEEDEQMQDEEETARLMLVQDQGERDILITDEDKPIIENDDQDKEPVQPQYSPFQVQSIEYNKSRELHTPDITLQNPLTYQQQQQNMLFSNAKPGENIKISDILKKTQSMNNGGESMNSFILDSSNNSQFIFQNQQINQSMNVPSTQTLLETSKEQLQLVDQITEQLLQQVLAQSFQIPVRKLDIQQQQHDIIQRQQIQLQQIENQDVFLIDAQQNEREMRRESIDYRQRQLIEADLQKAEIYINEIIETLLQSELMQLQGQNSDIVNYHKVFLNVLTNPIKKNEIDLLNQLQTSEIGSYDHFETTIDQSLFPILPIDLYLEIERVREEYQTNGGVDQSHENSVIQESVHIHNKAVFDALNESLMKFRPYGVQGEPMPWSNKNRRLQTKVDASSVDTERLFQMVKQDVLRWIATYSGCQPSPIFVFRKTNNNNQQNANPQIKALISEQEMFDEDQFQETRERRLAQMLASEVIETEHQWLNYEFEEAQVKIDLSDMILEHLVEEVVHFLTTR